MSLTHVETVGTPLFLLHEAAAVVIKALMTTDADESSKYAQWAERLVTTASAAGVTILSLSADTPRRTAYRAGSVQLGESEAAELAERMRRLRNSPLDAIRCAKTFLTIAGAPVLLTTVADRSVYGLRWSGTSDDAAPAFDRVVITCTASHALAVMGRVDVDCSPHRMAVAVEQVAAEMIAGGQ